MNIIGLFGPVYQQFTSNLMLDHIQVDVVPGEVGAGTVFAESRHDDIAHTETVTGPDTVRFDEVYSDRADVWTVGFMDSVRVGDLDMTVTARYDASMGVEGFDSIWTDLAQEPAPGESRFNNPMCTGAMTSCLTKGLVERFEERAMPGAFPAETGVLGLPGWH